MSVLEISVMRQAALCGIDPDTGETLDAELDRRIRQGKRDEETLRERPSLEELMEVIERTHEGLRWQMLIDPAHREEIKAALEASERRIRKMFWDHQREVRKQRAS